MNEARYVKSLDEGNEANVQHTAMLAGIMSSKLPTVAMQTLASLLGRQDVKHAQALAGR